MPTVHHVVIVGGGFGGINAALALRRAPARVTLLDRRNFHLFQPLLYQVATGGLSPANIASPLREILKRQLNTQVLLTKVTEIDAASRQVVTCGGRIAYDTLIVATGASHNYFGHDEWAERAPGLKTIEDATEIRRRILAAFEAAELEPTQASLATWMTFVVIGGGPTGVELAGAMAEIATDTLKGNFRRINPADAHIVLVEGGDRILPTYPPDLSAKAAASLSRLGVMVRTCAMVTDIQPDGVTIRSGDNTERIPTYTALWAAGVQASRLGRALAAATGCGLDRAGRVIVQPDLTVPEHPEIFVIGDLAHAEDGQGTLLPGLAPVAIHQGRYVGRAIRLRLGGRAVPPFCYRVLGSMATIGRGRAVANLGRLHLSGLPAWFAWLFVHLLGLVTFQNRLLVAIQWAWNYATFNRAARLITGVEEADSAECKPGAPRPGA